MTGAMKFQIAIHVSGGHVNPSLTVAAMVCRKVSIPMGFVYIVAQFLGGIIGYGLVIVSSFSHQNFHSIFTRNYIENHKV